MRLLNLGCGSRCHPDWINVDFVASQPGVIQYDLSKGIPFESGYFDVVYHSHVLEHFSKAQGIHFIAECFRVLKPSGIIRIAVPDLEQIARQYIRMLDEVELAENNIAVANYEWAVIEFLDQMVRRESGGEMLNYWQQTANLNEALLLKRMGNEYINWKKQYLATDRTNTVNYIPHTPKKRFQLFPVEKKKEISFEDSGEKHRWMYDRFSLKKLLRDQGFVESSIASAFESLVPGWKEYQWLDVEDDKIRKPDSLFIEAIKPAV